MGGCREMIYLMARARLSLVVLFAPTCARHCLPSGGVVFGSFCRGDGG